MSALTLPRPEARGRDGAAVRSRSGGCRVGHASGRGEREEVPGQHDCFQPGKCRGVL